MRTPPVPRMLGATAVFAWMVVAALGVGCDRHDGHGHGEGDAGGGEPSAAAILAAHAHDNPAETCFMCDASKRDDGRLWCKEHLRYEDRCWLCHPELEDKDRLYCREHFLYEDECFLCHPELKQDDASVSPDGSASRGDAGPLALAAPPATGQAPGGGLWCNEHSVYEAECAICQPELATTLEPGGNLKIRFPSASSAEKAGVQTSPPGAAASTPAIEALCEVQYNLNTMARVSPLAGGVIRGVRHDVGDRVAAGEVLAELHSAEVAAAKSDYLAALVDRDTRKQAFEREQRLHEQNITAEKDFLEARAAARAAALAANNFRQRLINLGLTEAEIARTEREQETSARLMVRAPFDGTVVERAAVAGEAVETGEALFTVADLSSRWLMLSVPSRHITRLREGQAVTARFDELPGVAVRGTITWIDTAIDPRSRMIKARALVTDGAGQIKTGLYGDARIVTGDARPATVVPRGAVQRHEGGAFVFVRDEPDLFSLRRVALGRSDGPTIEVLAGLNASDPVVTRGSFVVMSEFLKSRLGAGCVDH